MLHLVVALPAEARPLIRHFGLVRSRPEGLFPVFTGDGVRLVVAGSGKVCAGAAVVFLDATGPEAPASCVWLNVGVAGHATRAVGEASRIHRVTDAHTNRRWYPPQVAQLSGVSSDLMTVDRPETAYPTPALYDMEGAGFVDMACRCSSAELVQLFKVVSDNRASSCRGLGARNVESLVAAHVEEVARVAHTLNNLASRLAQHRVPVAQVRAFLDRWAFTVTQRHRLERLLRRWSVLRPMSTPDPADFRYSRSSREVLKALEKEIDGLPPVFGDRNGDD